MDYAYATLLLNESGEEINETNLTAVLEAAGVAVERSRVKALVAALEDVEVDDIGPADVDDEAADSPDDHGAPVSGDGEVDTPVAAEETEASERSPGDDSASER